MAGPGVTTTVVETEFKGKATHLVNSIDTIKKHTTDLDNALVAVINHLSAIEKKSLGATQNITDLSTRTYNNNSKTTKVTTSKASDTYAVNGVIASFKSGSKTASSRAASKQAIDAMQKENDLLAERIKKEHELIALTQEQTKLLAKRASYYGQDSDSRKLNATSNSIRANANMLKAQTKATESAQLTNFRRYKDLHPELFTTGGMASNARSQTSRGFNKVGDAISTWGNGGKVVGDILKVVGDFIKSPIAGTSTAISTLAKGIIELGKSATQAFAEIESIKTQLGVVFSNQTQANSMFGEIAQYAVHSPFGVQQTSELAVLLKQSGVYATDLMDTLRILGDTAGGNMEKMKRIANNYAQIVSIGKASMLDMRQFAYAGIPIFEAVSKELKVSQQELRKMISEGKVTSDIIEKVFKNLTGINGIFENATEKGAKTLKARLQNLQDAKQLAMGGIGEWGYSLGAVTGNDSFANNLVTDVENIYQHLKDYVNTVNIEKSVNVIENRDSKIAELTNLIEYLKKNGGTKTEIKELEKQLAALMSKHDVDQERSILTSSYDNKFNNYEQIKKAFDDSGIAQDMEKLWAGLGYTSEEKYSLTDYQTVAELYGMTNLAEIIKQLIKAEEGMKNITTEELQARRESNVINAQQLAFDQAAKSANKELSFANGFEKLFSLYRNSDEYKKKKEEEEVKWLKESQKVLKELLKYTDEAGNTDITKLSYKKFVEYLDDEKRVLTEGRKLTVVEGKSDLQMTEDRAYLEAQYKNIYNKLDSELAKKGNYAARNQMGWLNRGINYNADNATFFKEFARVLDQELSIFDDLIDNSKNDTEREEYKNMRKALLASTFKYEAPSKEGLNANPDDLTKGPEFVPLWKRILSAATGLTTNGMTDTLSTMTNYRDDMAIRNMTSSVISATMKTIGIDKAMGLMRTNSAQQLAGDTGKTFQVDWLATKKALKDFSTQLSASTEVVSAYKKGLEDELNVYQQLIAAGYTQAESTDLGSQKFVSHKQLQKLALGNSSQLVNAFGEVLETASGTKYKTSEIEFRNGEMFDKFGNKIEEEVVMTGNLFEFIKGELPRIYNELHEANAAQLNNEALSKMLKELAPTAYMTNVLKNGTSAEHVAFLANNPEYISSFVNSKISTIKNSDPLYASLKDMSVEDIILKALTASGKTKALYNKLEDYKVLQSEWNKGDKPDIDIDLINDEIDNLRKELGDTGTSLELLNLIFTSLDDNVSKLTDNSGFATLNEQLKNLSKTKALNSAAQNLIGAYSLNNIPRYLQNIPENYGGKRGNRNWLYRALGWNSDLFDKEDLYLEAAKAGFFKNESGKNRFVDEEGKSTIEGMDADAFVKLLDDADKKAVDLAYHFEKIAQSIDDMKVGLVQSMAEFTKGSFLAPFEEAGEWLVKDNDYAKGLQEKMKQLGAEMLSQMGTYMARAGFSLVAMGAETANYGLVAGGLALAAAGGFASGLGGALKESDNDDKNKKEIQKLENLKSDLQKLLEQARTDALYYENNLRHKTALGINKDFSYKSVHDAIITPKGIVETDPKDYLIATKTPQQFAGGNVSVTPIINCNVVNNTNSRVRQEQTQNSDGSIDIITIIEDAVGDYIVSPRSDGAFQARQYRINGRQAIM